MTTYIFNREKAVNEGFRESTLIDKAKFRRPAIKCLISELNKSNAYKLKDELIDGVTFKTREGELLSFKGQWKLIGRGNDRFEKVYSKYCQKEDRITLSEIVSEKNFKKKTVLAYIEGQSDNKYRLREIFNNNIDEIFELNLDSYYNITGKVVFLTLSKNKEVYKVNQIIELDKILND